MNSLYIVAIIISWCIFIGLILFQVSKSAIYRDGSMAGLVEGYRESYKCIPAIRSNFCALSGEQHLG